MSQLFNRYRGKIAENAVVLDMLPLRLQSRPMMRLCDEAVENFDKYPFDKINRWLGFILGVLAAVGAVDVDEERDFSRPLLHSFHEAAVASFAEVMSQLFNRYRGKIAENTVVLDMLPLRLQSKPMLRLCDEAVENFDKYPFDKINRWLGSIQGVLAAVGAVDVDEERDFSRPLLHSFHEGAVASFATTNETLKHKPERIQS